MLALVVALSLSQAPRCLDKGVERVCGYSCVENSREAACARTPAGVCGKTSRAVRCFDPPSADAPRPTCLVAGAELDCGYDCKKSNRGDVTCARTPAGVCGASSRDVTCFDPPGDATAKPSCLVAGAAVACGYDCKATKTHVVCARTPAGVCGASSQELRCFEPPADANAKPSCLTDGAEVACGFDCKAKGGHVACTRTVDGVCGVSTELAACFDPPWTPEDPKRTPTCITEGAALACGYECVRAGGQVMCARSPDGRCATSGARVACFDPPAWARSAAVAKPSCVSSGDGLACGYDCKREGEKLACATTPKGKCVAHGGEITCFDPPPVAYAVSSVEVPEPTCVSHDGGVTCGFSCTSGNGGVACAQTPFGVCAENGSTCFDPGVSLLCSALSSLQRPECVVASGGKAACGYHCVVVGKKAACAQTPAGRCTGLVCTDPPVRRVHSTCLERAFAR